MKNREWPYSYNPIKQCIMPKMVLSPYFMVLLKEVCVFGPDYGNLAFQLYILTTFLYEI